MRMIGHLDGEAKARTFSDFLYAQGIENQIEADKDNSWSVWIHSEEQLDQSRELLQKFVEQPADPKFQSVASAAKGLREQKREEALAYEKRVKQRQNLFRPITGYGFGPVTFILILMSVIVMIASSMSGPGTVDVLSISDSDIANAHEVGIRQGIHERVELIKEVLPEVRHGQIWRLITPIFIHFGIMHIFFNMLWLRDLGSMIEGRQSSLMLVVLVLGIAVVSNIGQYFVSGIGFGGMSGVVYGLLGYIWVRGKRDPASGLFLHPTNVTMMLIWLFACMTGWLGPIANTCHFVGLVMGILWGFFSSLPHGLHKLR